jgi:hypothetical protein
MERSEIREHLACGQAYPDCAALHPGYMSPPSQGDG